MYTHTHTQSAGTIGGLTTPAINGGGMLSLSLSFSMYSLFCSFSLYTYAHINPHAHAHTTTHTHTHTHTQPAGTTGDARTPAVNGGGMLRARVEAADVTGESS